jgi:hypothetical protein
VKCGISLLEGSGSKLGKSINSQTLTTDLRRLTSVVPCPAEHTRLEDEPAAAVASLGEDIWTGELWIAEVVVNPSAALATAVSDSLHARPADAQPRRNLPLGHARGEQATDFGIDLGGEHGLNAECGIWGLSVVSCQ